MGQSRPGSNGIEGVHHIPQSSSITGTSPSDCLASYLGHSLEGESYFFADMQLLYCTASADWAKGLALGESYPSVEMKSVCSTDPANRASNLFCFFSIQLFISLCAFFTDLLGEFLSLFVPLNHLIARKI